MMIIKYNKAEIISIITIINRISLMTDNEYL